MKSFLNKFKELSYEELLEVNGGYGSSSSARERIAAHKARNAAKSYDPKTSGLENLSTKSTSNSSVPTGYDPKTGWKDGYGPKSSGYTNLSSGGETSSEKTIEDSTTTDTAYNPKTSGLENLEKKNDDVTVSEKEGVTATNLDNSEVQNDPVSGTWGKIEDTDNRAATMQDLAKTDEDSQMNGAPENKFSTVGCKMEGTAKVISEITGNNINVKDVNDNYDTNQDGLMIQSEIAEAIRSNLPESKTLTTDYYEKTLSKSTLDSISASDGTTYILGRAEDVHVGQHWVGLEGYSINEYGQVQFDYNATSANDSRNSRTYILGAKNENQSETYTISKIEVYTIN